VCETCGKSGAWSDLRSRVSMQDVIESYGDQKAPMQLRMLAEAVYGAGLRRSLVKMKGTSMML
jgi:splicing suppressor protein 51